MNSAALNASEEAPSIKARTRSLGETQVVDLLYLVYLFGVVIMSTLGYTAGDTAYFVLVALGATFALLRFLALRFDGRFLVLTLALIAVGAVGYFVSRRFTLLLTSMLLVAARGIDVRRLLGTFFAAKLMGLALLGVLVALGVFEVEHFQYWKSGFGAYIDRVRINGNGTNLLHLSYVTCVVLWFYLRHGKVSFVFYLVAAFLNMAVYGITKSTMGFVVGFGSPALFLIVQHSLKLRQAFLPFSKCLVPLLLIFSFGTAILYGNNSFVDWLDSLFQGRIYYDSYFLKSYPFSLFGHGMMTNEGNFDNSFVFVWVAYGALTFVLVFASMQSIIGRFAREGDWTALAVICVFLVIGLSESFYPAAAVNPSLFFLLPLFDARPRRDGTLSPGGKQ